MPLLFLRRAARVAAVALTAAVASPAAAQVVSVANQPAPACTTALCTFLRFTLSNPGTGTLTFATLQLTATDGFTFRPDVSGGTSADVTGADAIGTQAATGTIGASGTTLFIDFAAPGAFPFQLGDGTTGFLDLQVESGGPALGSGSFTFSGTLDSGAPVSGPVAGPAPTAVVPEPATVVLVGGGLAGLAAAARRRRGA
jgi:hypothetical protein